MNKLLSADPRRIGRPDVPPTSDAVDEERVGGTLDELKTDLISILGEDLVRHRISDLVRYASDASPYRYIPTVIVQPKNIDHVAAIFRYCVGNGCHATFRAGGTSLNGQAQGDGILIDVRQHWSGWTVEDKGSRIRCNVGTTLGRINEVLKPYGRRMGPDPASINAATIGGVLANNAGGMRCRPEIDSYHSIVAMKIILTTGTIVDTEDPHAEEHFAAAEPEMAAGLMKIRDELLADQDVSARIIRKYEMRNTTGYAIHAFLDGKTPVEILRRLMVGSEGTLGFVAEAVYKTYHLPAKTMVVWLPFETIDAAVEQVAKLVELGAQAVELMVASALTAASRLIRGTPKYWKDLDPKNAALLVEFGLESDREFEAIEKRVGDALRDVAMLQPLEFTRDAEAIELAWHVRDGLLGIVGEARPQGTSLIIEDVYFPPARLANATRDLLALLAKHGYNASAAGHAAYGNLHFVMIARLSEDASRQQYDRFMRDLVELVVDKYDGSLKAEHGTGLNMAPFVRREWGDKLTDLMWRVKRLLDPHGILAPNILLSHDPEIHLKNLKTTPAIEDVHHASHCIECGFCEPVCPSRNVTVTPRQRIVLRREMSRQPEWSKLLTQLQREYEYDAIETCAVDGTCADVCPIGINTGALIKHLRKMENSTGAEEVALDVARKWAEVEKLARRGVNAADIVQAIATPHLLEALTDVARGLVSNDLVPTVAGPMPHAAPANLPATKRSGAAAAYFPACINRIFGRDNSKPASPALPETFVTLSERAGKSLWIPDDVRGLCCSTPWSSKGYKRGQTWMSEQMSDALWRWSNGGKLPVVVDAASCTLGLKDDILEHLDDERKDRLKRITIIDSIAWCKELLSSLRISKTIPNIVVHPTCSTTHLGLTETLVEIASALADRAEIPLGTTCCGTAGDRGLLHPELVHSATRDTVVQIQSSDEDTCFVSANRTCELGMRQTTGRVYESFIYALEEASRPS
ncbi:MAG TPA: FAD-binding and (Fe-S)-binding domain-containing protein [Bryobacteraceae bacterium]|nr:FAD-binding and (Fe-S)-binding domain-containing protein [Bryobacteraceae bacterium]